MLLDVNHIGLNIILIGNTGIYLHFLWFLKTVMVQAFEILQSINQSNPVLLNERVRIPRTRCAGGAAMLWGALPFDGVGSCRLFFTDDLHDTLSWVPASDKPHTFNSCFTHSSQVFFGRPGPFLPGTGMDLTLPQKQKVPVYPIWWIPLPLHLISLRHTAGHQQQWYWSSSSWIFQFQHQEG